MAAVDTGVRKYRVYVVYSLIALAIMAPLLAPGHILTLDMALTPQLPMPDSATSSYLFRLVLYVLNIIVPTEIIEKLLFFLILLMSGVGIHRLVQHLKPTAPPETYATWAPYIGGVLYMINPYTYSRFMAGQYSVLLGYAALPFFVRALLDFMERPSLRTILILTAWAVGISIVSIHSLGLLALVLVAAIALYGWRYRSRPQHLRRIGYYGAIGLATGLLISSYWLVPILRGTSSTARVVGGFGTGDQAAFATLGGNLAGQVSNVVRLQGFWAEGRELFLLPQEVIPAWGLVVLGVWILVACGWLTFWRNGQRPAAALLALTAGGAILMASGLANRLSNWLPLLDGYREPHKFVGLVALCFACLAGVGAAVVMGKQRSNFRSNLTMGGLLLVPVLFTPTMFWGFARQLKPRHYPAEWFAMNERLNQDKSRFQVVFLPWHRYMHFGFAGRIIANPADDFFDKSMIVSVNPEFGGASPDQVNAEAEYIDTRVLPGAADRSDLGTLLNKLHIKYVLLAKEVNAEDFDYLNDQPDLRLIHQDNRLRLYRNMVWEK